MEVTDGDMDVLYVNEYCPYCERVRIFANENDIFFCVQDLASLSENKLVSENPFKTSPLFREVNVFTFGSINILEHLKARDVKQRDLWPEQRWRPIVLAAK